MKKLQSKLNKIKLTRSSWVRTAMFYGLHSVDWKMLGDYFSVAIGSKEMCTKSLISKVNEFLKTEFDTDTNKMIKKITIEYYEDGRYPSKEDGLRKEEFLMIDSED